MKKTVRSFLSIVLSVALVLCLFCGSTAFAEDAELTAAQRNAIAMLNYITVLSQEINASKNSRMYLEEAYSALINNTYPNAVDSRTLSQLTGLLDTMENYRMIAVKRDRLQYIYEQSQAQAIRSAIPNPIGLIGAVGSFSPAKLVSSVVYMAVDSATSYKAYTSEAEQKYLQDGWALDDEEAKVLHESRKGTFSYMVRMVNDYGLPGDLTLTEDTVAEYVKYQSVDLTRRIQFLESNKSTYQSYGGYWLALAECYYKNGDYQKCLDAVTTYESLGTRIFRRDYDLARVLPLAIASAKEVQSMDVYAPYASSRVKTIINNTDHDDWALRYFAAQTLVDLYAETHNASYLQDAYKIVVDNVNYLVSEQHALNESYLAKIKSKKEYKKDQEYKDADKSEKKQIEAYYEMLEDTRKTELPPVYEPLKLNCDLLFAIADEISISATEKTKMDRILHPNGDRLFLTEAVDDQYWFNNSVEPIDAESMEIAFGGTVIIMPARYITSDASIVVSVVEPGKTTPVVISDWTIDKVDRATEGDISTFEAAFSSKTAKKYSWVPNSTVTVQISPTSASDVSFEIEFKTEGTKNAWYDYLKVWEGHKNNWYEYAKVWENSVNFVRVK